MRHPRVRLLPTKGRAQMIYSFGGFEEEQMTEKSLCHPPEMLNQLSRRGVLKSLAIAPFLVKNTILKLVWQAAGKTPPLSVAAVLGFLRSLNNAQILLHFKNGQFGAVEDVLGAVASHREHYKPGTGPYEWMSRFNPFSDEVLPGHFLDYALITAGYPRVLSDERKVQNGYRVVLRGEHYTFITDEETVIYMTVTPEQAPPASSLPSAREFPGATPFGTFRPPQASLGGWDTGEAGKWT